jgi:hypothetical protein
MSAILKNESKHPVVLVLDHAAFATKAAGWSRTTARFGFADDQGSRVVKEVRRAYPGSLTIFPGASTDPLHDAVVHCAQVPSLIAQRVLSVTHVADKPEVVTSRIQTDDDAQPSEA